MKWWKAASLVLLLCAGCFRGRVEMSIEGGPSNEPRGPMGTPESSKDKPPSSAATPQAPPPAEGASGTPTR